MADAGGFGASAVPTRIQIIRAHESGARLTCFAQEERDGEDEFDGSEVPDALAMVR
jgi:hypothetical protein